jgi:hypothetical protein
MVTMNGKCHNEWESHMKKSIERAIAFAILTISFTGDYSYIPEKD